MTDNKTGTGTISWHRDDDGVVTLTIDDPERRVNTMTEAFVDDLGAALVRIESEKDSITGVIVTSGKSTFFAGGDLADLRTVTKDQADEFAVFVDRNSRLLRRLETVGVPVVAAVNGAALGGGLELALAAHHRIVLDGKRVRLGLPEVTLGLLPGAGGVVRTVRLLGLETALDKVLLGGHRFDAHAARELGLIDEVVDSQEALIAAAKQWIASGPEPVQPWDRKGFTIPGGSPADRSSSVAAHLALLPARLEQKLKGANYPAPRNILAAAVEGARLDVDGALKVEARYFVDLATGLVAKNMIQTFFDTQEVSGARGRDADRAPWKATKAIVLGAGMMGAGIAYECARAGIEVVLQDLSAEAAERGKAYSEKVVGKAVQGGRMSAEDGQALLARIRPTTDVADAAGADIVVEAVFEDPAIKDEVLRRVEPHLAEGALIGSNTSTLPISGLADSVPAPERFIGLHFFSPVDRMPLIEIIKGTKTDAETVSRALDFAKQIGKTPIVVNDSRGFFTSRVIGTFINEALALLGEGVPAPSIEQASAQAGYPAPVLQLADELNLELLRRVRNTGREAAIAEGRTWQAHPAEAVVDAMIDVHARPGRLGGAGFHEYVDGRRAGLWSGLSEAFGGNTVDVPLEDMRDRMLFVEALESYRCLDEDVLESVADANVGSILGIGYPAWTGGVLRLIDGYEGGPAGFVARADELAARYGERFAVPSSLRDLASAGGLLVDGVRAPA